jgi:hypothetical protein
MPRTINHMARGTRPSSKTHHAITQPISVERRGPAGRLARQGPAGRLARKAHRHPRARGFLSARSVRHQHDSPAHSTIADSKNGRSTRPSRTRKSRRPTLASGPSKTRQRPTLPQGCPCSTIGPEKLNFRVRDGNGCDLFGIAARKNLTKCEARLAQGPTIADQCRSLPVRAGLSRQRAGPKAGKEPVKNRQAINQSDKHSYECHRSTLTTLKQTITSIVFNGSAIADGVDLLPARLEPFGFRWIARSSR